LNYLKYLQRYDELIKSDKSFIYPKLENIFMGILAFVHLFSSIGCLSLVLSQISGIISDKTFYEKNKNENLERQYCLAIYNNKEKEVK